MRFTCGYASNAALANDLESLREAELDVLINLTGGEQVVVAAPDFLHHAHRVLKSGGRYVVPASGPEDHNGIDWVAAFREAGFDATVHRAISGNDKDDNVTSVLIAKKR